MSSKTKPAITIQAGHRVRVRGALSRRIGTVLAVSRDGEDSVAIVEFDTPPFRDSMYARDLELALDEGVKTDAGVKTYYVRVCPTERALATQYVVDERIARYIVDLAEMAQLGEVELPELKFK
jgi:hypothetical protein